jgi:hypothetical protein
MSEHLSTYLNDHRSGSSLALELLEHLERAYEGTPLARFAVELRTEIEDDRKELETVMARSNVAESRPRKAAAWLSEKFAELKLRLDDPSAGPLRLLEILDALSLGVEGKRLLWRSLATAAETLPELTGTDYTRLVERAEDQRRRLEVLRLEAARSALAVRPAVDR